jgi:hypothetical protein
MYRVMITLRTVMRQGQSRAEENAGGAKNRFAPVQIGLGIGL